MPLENRPAELATALPAPDDDETTRWFDEEFANAIQGACEPLPMSFENYVQFIEHRELLSSFSRRSPAAR